jgi:putative membrane protein
MDAAALSSGSDRRFFVFNAVLSTGALGLLAWLLLIRGGGGGGADLRFMPAVNAGLNATATLLLLGGWISVKRGNPRVHRYFMVGAVACSALFLVGYLAYHYVHGDTKFGGTGTIRTVYLAILATHVLLSMAVVPLVLSALWFAAKKQFARHTRVTRILFPVWLYVSVTGVVIFFLLRGHPTAS